MNGDGNPERQVDTDLLYVSGGLCAKVKPEQESPLSTQLLISATSHTLQPVFCRARSETTGTDTVCITRDCSSFSMWNIP